MSDHIEGFYTYSHDGASEHHVYSKKKKKIYFVNLFNLITLNNSYFFNIKHDSIIGWASQVAS